jgi:superfamily I DNA/RNA helicase
VLTVKRTVRDHLRAQLGFVSWEESDERSIACETVHRAKGLEFDHVILVLPEEDVSDALLYIGISRAISGLSVVAPSALATRIGLVTEAQQKERP